MLLDKTAFVARMTRDISDADKEAFVTHSGFVGPLGIATAAIKINIQPADAQLVAISDGVIGKTYKAFTRASGVLEGMRLTISGTGERYMVTGREPYNYGVEEHYELTVTKATR